MKKLILLAICMISTTSLLAQEQLTTSSVYSDSVDAISTIYNDSKDVVSTVYNDVKDITKDLYPEVKQAVSAIASGIGVAAEHVYTILVKKYIVEGVGYLIRFIIGIGLLCFAVFKLSKLPSMNDFKLIHMVYIMLLFPGILLVCLTPFNTMLSCLINPEWEVINYVLEYAKTFV